MHHDLVAFPDRLDPFPHLQHRRATLVTQQVRQELIGAFGALDLVDLGAADAAVLHLDQHLAEAQAVGRLDFRELERRMLLHQYRGLDLDREHWTAYSKKMNS